MATPADDPDDADVHGDEKGSAGETYKESVRRFALLE
jgi:hypothetical protein